MLRPILAATLACSTLACGGIGSPSAGAATCGSAAPTSAVGFAALWDRIPTDQWGAADGSMSFTMPKDPRHEVVWLYGDTFEPGNPTHPFVHSTAIIQTAGCVHVSYTGAVVLPNDVTNAVDSTGLHYDIAYWIETAYNSSSHYLHVTARRMRVNYNGTFQDLGTDRVARVSITAYNNAKFLAWLSSATTPEKPGQYVNCPATVPYDYNRVCYNPASHLEAKMSSGKRLWTVNETWRDDNGTLTHTIKDYRPLFFELPVGILP